MSESAAAVADAPKKNYNSLVEKLDELPTLPAVVYELSQIINDPMTSTTEIEKVMEQDQSLTAKVLKLINSAYYAIPGGVTSLSRAIGYLGLDTVNQLVLSTSILKALEVNGPTRFDLNKFWQHAIGVGIAAECIAKSVRHRSPADLFTSGLVHDIGKVAIYILDPDLLVSTSKHATENSLTLAEAEEALQVPKHTVLGQLLAKKWNLPVSIQYPILYHHQKDIAKRVGVTPDLNINVDIVLLANILIQALKFGNSGHTKIQGAPKAVLERLAIEPANLPNTLADIKNALDNAQGFLSLIQGK
jgi:HD-like signal output (HDOD) protein